MKTLLSSALLVLIIASGFAMPPRLSVKAPHSCIVGRALTEPKDLQNYTIETCVILVQFADNLADTLNNTPARYDSMFYSAGIYQGTYRAGSLNDFFIENSYNATDVSGGICGNTWHLSNYTYSHYYDGYYMLTTGYALARDAVILVDDLVDFQQFDADNNGHIDGVFVVHAGPGAEDTGNINHCWSHAIPSFYYTTNDGIIIDGATNVPEVNLVTPSLDTTLCCIGVMCHELGHIVGLPDLYDGSRNTWGVGYWSLMGYGAWGAGGNTPWSPSHADAWCKTIVNWLAPIPITSNTYSLKIVDLETNPVAYRVWRNGIVNDTFFILENRQNKGFDTPLPGQGLLIWHIDPRYGVYHNVVDLEEADGCDDLDDGWGYRPDPHYYHPELGDSGDPFPGDSSTTVFDSLSYPSSNDNWGNPTHVTVRNISLVADTVVCDVIIDPSSVAENTSTMFTHTFEAVPNPFTKQTTINFVVENSVRNIEISIYDISGKLVRNLTRSMSDPLCPTHIIWQGDDGAGCPLPDGIYLVKARAGDYEAIRKLILLK